MKNWLKIGVPSYFNVYPLLYKLCLPSEIKLFFFPPKMLNQKLLSGELDAALSSSIFYARNFERFLILPDLSISAVGEVKSVILLVKKNITSFNKVRIFITPETESSLALLKVLCAFYFKEKPIFLEEKKNFEELCKFESPQAYLAIGNEALFLGQNKKILENYKIFDLAQIWLAFTEKPFVFAFFIVNKSSFKQYKGLLKEFLINVFFARALAFSNLDTFVKDILNSDPTLKEFDKNFIKLYFSSLEYDFSFLKQKAFLKFCELASKEGLIKGPVKLQFAQIF